MVLYVPRSDVPEERTWLAGQHGAAVALGGRRRTSGATDERARVAVRKAIVAALARVGPVDSADCAGLGSVEDGGDRHATGSPL